MTKKYIVELQDPDNENAIIYPTTHVKGVIGANGVTLENIEPTAQENVIEVIEYDGEELIPVNKKVSIPGYKIIKENIPASGMAATYSLYKGETSTGNTINIPLDVRLTNVQCKICEKKDVPEEGFKKGNWYLDFTLENAEKNHIYVNLKDISSGVYSQGTGIIIENSQIRIDDTIVVTHEQLNSKNFITYEQIN